MKSFIGDFRKLGNLSKPWVSGGNTETIFGIPPITTRKHKLLSLKAFGGTEQRSVLPSEYTQVEYLESNGTQYIDTGIVLKSEATITMVAQATSFGSIGPYSFWGFMGDSNNSPRWGWSIFSNNWLPSLNETVSALKADTAKHTFVNTCYYVDTRLYYDSFVDSNSIFEFVRSVSDVTLYTSNTLSVYLFARNNNGIVGNLLSCKIFSYKIVQDGVKVLSLIPCRRNSDNVLGMYDTVTGNFLTNQGTGTFIAGADVTTPSPETPMDIWCNNGVLKVNTEVSGKNAVDISDVVHGYLSSNPGREPVIQASSASQVIKKAIRVSSGKQYKFSYVSTIVGSRESEIVGEDGLCKAKFNLSCSAGLNEYIINASFDGYLWITVQSGDLAIVSPVIYEIGQIYADGTVETIQVHGKNLFDAHNWVLLPDSKITIIDANTMQVDSRTYQEQYNYFDLPPHSQEMCISFHCKTLSISGDAKFSLIWRRQNTLLNFLRIELVSRGYEQDVTIIIPANATQLVLGNWGYSGSFELSNIQLEQGSTATAYEPYYNGGTATAEMLLKVGDYQDVQSILDGVVTRNVGVKVLDGTEIWKYSNGVLHWDIGPTGIALQAQTLCTSYAYGTSGNFTMCGGNSWKLQIRDNRFTDANTFKTWLAQQYSSGTPIIVLYNLATPTTEQVAGQTLALTRGTNIIDITQASLDNLELEVKAR